MAASAESFLPGPTGRSPNILLITVDTLRADHLSAWGYARDTSPSLPDQRWIGGEGKSWALFDLQSDPG